jgi:ribonuclease HI
LLVDSGLLEHDCLGVMDKAFSSWLDLTDQPISHLDVEYFTDGISFVQDSTYFSRYAIVTLDAVIETCLVLVRTSAQKTELTALTQVLQLTTGGWVNIYMDSKYAFTSIHVYGALYKKGGLINLGGKSVKYEQEILEFLEAVWAPQ